MQVDIEAGGKVVSLDGHAPLNGRIDFEAGIIDAVDGAAGLTLELVVEVRLEAVTAHRAFHAEGFQLFTGEVTKIDILVDADETKRVRGGRIVWIIARGRGVNLQGRLDRQLLEEARVFLGLEIVDEHVWQQGRIGEVAHEVVCIHPVLAAEDLVDLVQVGLDDGDLGDLFELAGVGDVLVAEFAVVFAHADELAAELAAQLVEVNHDGEARAVADEQAALAVVDVAARAGHKDAALVLLAFLRVVNIGLQELLPGQAEGKDQEQAEGDEIKKYHAHLVIFARLDDEGAGAFGDAGSGHEKAEGLKN